MEIDKNEFFRKATMQICGSLDIGTATHRSLVYLRQFIPMDWLSLYLYDEGLGGHRCIAVATGQEGKRGDMILPLPREARDRLQRMDVPHISVERSEFDPVILRIVNRPEADPVIRSFTQFFDSEDYSVLVMYLSIEGKNIGTLFLRAYGKDRYTEEHARLLALLAEPFAIALSNTLRFEEVLKLKDLLADDNRYLQRELLHISGDQIIGGDFGLRSVLEMVGRVASLNSPVLLRGETGAGKDVIANAIHYSSARRDGPFIKVNCGAIPEALVDSELFGHEKGAFTGAIAQKRGCFERANGGTIFLDEIGELPLPAQVRMLRVLQYHEIERLGGSAHIPVDIRVIAATHRNLEQMVETKLFREDLWFRLNVFPIFIPPLRERRADIPALVHHLMIRKSRELKLPKVPALAPGTIDCLMAYQWPGNVRELENAIERALILGKGDTLFLDAFRFLFQEERMPLSDADGVGPVPLEEVLAQHIRKALQVTGGKVHGPEGAARLLGVNPSTLRNRMNKLGIRYGRHR